MHIKAPINPMPKSNVANSGTAHCTSRWMSMTTTLGKIKGSKFAQWHVYILFLTEHPAPRFQKVSYVSTSSSETYVEDPPTQ